MAVRTHAGWGPAALADARLQVLSAREALVLPLALPLLFLHVEHQPGFTVGLGSADVHVALSDLAVLAVAAVALAVAFRRGLAPLRASRPVWAASAGLLAAVGLSTVYGAARFDEYPFATHAVTALKFAEYALLALAAPLLLRRLADVGLLLWALALWSAAATIVALLQFLGADVAGAWPAGYRQPAFLGHHDFAALSGAAFALAVAALAVPGRWPFGRVLPAVGGVAGGAGLVLSGSTAGAIGAAAAAGAAATG